ncbi:MAG TPA: aminotransferase class V-fold PLP-dependent enzyme [Candidatus Aminicenantes bacterium]|nr:aminotransferase class V-fold PLP-dependent enzyme [Candidatus Aminicenantes bacterium]
MNTEKILEANYNIACRTGLHCAPLGHEQLGTAKIHGSVRFAIGPFNTEEDIQTAIQAVKEVAQSQKK